MYGFIYITTNHINGKKYIGQKKYDKNEKWKDYLGSGIVLTRALNKHGRENFSKEIIEECGSKKQLNEREKYWISYYNAVESDEFYNIASGGDGGRTCYGSTHHASKKVYQYDKVCGILSKIIDYIISFYCLCRLYMQILRLQHKQKLLSKRFSLQ